MESVPLVSLKIIEHLKYLIELVTQEKTEEWASFYGQNWNYIFRNKKEILDVDPQFLVDTCVHFFLNGVTVLPAYVEGKFREQTVLETLLPEGFITTPFLPEILPESRNESWMRLYIVHHRVLTKILHQDEEIRLIEFGGAFLGKRARIGTIVLTNQRLILIGRNRMGNLLHPIHCITYPQIGSFAVESYKLNLGMMKPTWIYFVTPEPQSAAFYGSVDYFETHTLSQLTMSDNSLACTFSNQLYTEIKRREHYYQSYYLSPFWFGFKLDAKQSSKTGDFLVEIILMRLRPQSDDNLRSRYAKLKRAIEDVSKLT